MSDAESGASMAMPRYQSHKKVYALEIASCTMAESTPHATDPTAVAEHPGHTMTFKEEGYAPINVPQSLVARFYPSEGDFYVVYDDGYQSISPRQPFLDGYTKL